MSDDQPLGHGPCSVCGSSDARARWSDGHEHCFSCGDHQGSSLRKATSQRRSKRRYKPRLLGPPTLAQSAYLSRRYGCGCSPTTLGKVKAQRATFRGREGLFLPAVTPGHGVFLYVSFDGSVGRKRKKGTGELRITIGKASFLSHGSGPEALEVEGVTDWLAAIEAGIPRVLSPTTGASGTPAALRNCPEVRQGLQRVDLVRDNDEAGERSRPAAERAWQAAGLHVHPIHLPEDLGPGGDLRDLLLRLGGVEKLHELRRLATKAAVPGSALPNTDVANSGG